MKVRKTLHMKHTIFPPGVSCFIIKDMRSRAIFFSLSLSLSLSLTSVTFTSILFFIQSLNLPKNIESYRLQVTISVRLPFTWLPIFITNLNDFYVSKTIINVSSLLARCFAR